MAARKGLIGRIVVGAVVLGGSIGAALYIVATSGVPVRTRIPDAIRGTNAFYAAETLKYDLPELTANLRGTMPPRLLRLEISVVYRLGAELADAAPRFEQRSAGIRDRLILLISSKEYDEIDRRAVQDLLREEIRAVLQETLFPEGEARIDDVLLRSIYVQ